ncbi:MAG TPA: dihydrofolate reductase [Flavobacteriales bacterium]|nr:dihydrofolate reductase [Flavobacteriales bacterium]
MRFKLFYLIPVVLCACGGGAEKTGEKKDLTATVSTTPDTDSNFVYQTEQFADLRILRYQIPGFNQLTPKQKELLYYLYEAALCGRDILYDQNCKYNLTLRKTLENIVSSYNGDKETEEWGNFMVYAKRFWFSNGLHHHYNSDKIMPEFSKVYFKGLIKSSDQKGFPMEQGEDLEKFSDRLCTIIYDPKVAAKKVNLDPKQDIVATSATNFYEGVTQKEVEEYHKAKANKETTTPVMYGLNSKLVKEDGKIVEKVWKVGGMYSPAIEKIVYWLEKAVAVAENAKQKEALQKLIKFYKSGDLKDFDDYSIAWVKDTESSIDVVNGFIEVYGDPMGYRGSYESVVSVRDPEASKRIKAIGAEAQWFEDNSPLMPEHKKKNVKGISAKVINVVIEGGDATPSTPIGINLPNNNWIREQHGSKSVNLGNIVEAYDRSAGKGIVDEFYYGQEVKDRIKKCGALADKLHTDMHEVIGHASGQMNPGVGQPSETLKNYANALEEGRADLVALYYLLDPKLVELGVMPSLEYGKAHYDAYITKGLMIQLSRIKKGNDLEEAHMRNRQMIALWAYEKGKKDNVIEKKVEGGKTYFIVNDYEKLRALFGELLREIQRVKSEGDFEGGKALIENYGRKIDPKLHAEVLDRYASLGIAPYPGFIQPVLVPVKKGDKIMDVTVEYPMDFVEQMLMYGREYSLLPVKN